VLFLLSRSPWVPTACRAIESLIADQKAVIEPDTDTPFNSVEDAIKRLLPYHVFQLPKEDNGKGKRKATEEDLLREQLAGANVSLYF
jgi:hypothetical protein